MIVCKNNSELIYSKILIQFIIFLLLVLFAWNLVGAEKGIGLTSRLNRVQIREYLAKADTIPREQLEKDLESIGLKVRGKSPTGLFKTFEDKASNLRIKIHPPDETTSYSHLHIYDKAGNSLTANLTRAPYDAPEVHIKIEPIQQELEWRLTR